MSFRRSPLARLCSSSSCIAASRAQRCVGAINDLDVAKPPGDFDRVTVRIAKIDRTPEPRDGCTAKRQRLVIRASSSISRAPRTSERSTRYEWRCKSDGVFRHVSVRVIGADVIEKRDCRTLSRVEEKMKEIRMSRRPPPSRADGVDQRKSEDVAVEFNRLSQFPCWPCGVIDAVEPQSGGRRDLPA